MGREKHPVLFVFSSFFTDAVPVVFVRLYPAMKDGDGAPENSLSALPDGGNKGDEEIKQLLHS
ncbi:hypothetical protein WCU54_15315 [Dickeya dadantii]|uniref:hypothetical protein n=1 Tax=Dickeya dadantii TaxID=204038 RepID=UPI00187BCF4E